MPKITNIDLGLFELEKIRFFL